VKVNPRAEDCLEFSHRALAAFESFLVLLGERNASEVLLLELADLPLLFTFQHRVAVPNLLREE
jgi:hypothetical protein